MKLNINKALKDRPSHVKVLKRKYIGHVETWFLDLGDIVIPVNKNWDHDIVVEFMEGKHREHKEFFETLEMYSRVHPLYMKHNHFLSVAMTHKNRLEIEFGINGKEGITYLGMGFIYPDFKELLKELKTIAASFYSSNIITR